MATGLSISGPGIMDMRALAVRLKGADADMRARLRRELEAEGGPVVRRVQASARSMPVHGTYHDRPPSMLGQIAGTVGAAARDTAAGARLVIVSDGRKMPAGMEHLPILTNRARGWGHPVFPRASVPRSRWNWAHQTGKPGWFDQPVTDSHDNLEAAVNRAVAGFCRDVEG